MPRGSKPGERRGGRQKGSRNRATTELIAKANEFAKGGVAPLTMFLKTARALWDEAVAIDAETGKETLDIAKAKEACEFAAPTLPYVHPRLNAVDKGRGDGLDAPTEQESMSDLELARIVAFTVTRGAREAAKSGLPVPRIAAPARAKRKATA